MTDIREKKEHVKMHLKELRQNLKKMHLAVTEELTLPQPDDVKFLMNIFFSQNLYLTSFFFLPFKISKYRLTILKFIDKLN